MISTGSYFSTFNPYMTEQNRCTLVGEVPRMDVRAMRSAREIFVVELNQLDRDFEQIRSRKAQLEAILANLDNLLKSTESPVLEPVIQQRREPQVLPVDTRASWEIIRDVFPPSGDSLTVPQIHKLVNADGVKIVNPDAIRIAMRRHPEVFINNGGQYTLRNPSTGGVLFNAKEATGVAS